MSDPLGLFSEGPDNDPLGLFDDEPKPKSFLDSVVSGAKGTAAAIGDFAGGIIKIPVRSVLAIGGKIAEPDRSLQDTWDTAGQAVEETYPAFGKDMQDNLGYTVPLKPFELYGQGIEKVAKVASMGNKDVEGAINIGGNLLPIPFVGKGVNAAKKGMAALDPTLRNVKAPPIGPEIPKTVVPEIKPEPPKIPIDQLELDLFSPDQKQIGMSPYNVDKALWHVDENGIPVKQQLSEEVAQHGEQMDMFPPQEPVVKELSPQGEMDAAWQQRQEAEAADAQARQQEWIDTRVAELRQKAQEASDAPLEALQDKLTPERVSKGQKRKAMNKQRGAIDVDAVKETIDFMKQGFMTGMDVLRSYKGAFHPDEMQKAMDAINDPKSRDTIVLMSPQDFHDLAAKRTQSWMEGEYGFGGAPEKQFAVRVALQGEKGLRDIPYLNIDEKGVVKGHEGRHRMDVFKEHGLEQVPVRIHSSTLRWGEVDPSAYPPVLKGERGSSGKSIPLPEPLTTRYNSQGMRIPKGQRGAIDASFLDGVAKKGKEALEKLRETAWNKFWDNGRNYDGPEYQDVKAINEKIFELEKRERTTAGNNTQQPKEVFPGYTQIPSGTKVLAKHGLKYSEPTRGTVVGTKDVRFEDGPYRLPVVDFGDGVPRTVLPSDISEVYGGPKIPPKQRGALLFGKSKETATLGKDSPGVEQALKRNEQIAKVKAVLGTDEGFRADMDTPEKVVAAALGGAKDISTFQRIRGTTITAGANRLAGATNNPIVKFVRDGVGKARRDAENIMRTFVTDKDGLGPMWNKLSQSEKNEVMGAWKLGDEHQKKFTQADMDEAGFTPRQQQTLEHIYKMQDYLFERTNKAYEKAGLQPIRKREGHMPGIFKGDYSSLVLTRDGVDKAGKPVWKPLGYIGADTLIQHEMIKKKVEAQYQGPGIKIERIKRHDVNQVPHLQGEVGALYELLGKNDPAFAKVNELLKSIAAESAAKLYGASLHAKEKIGVFGNEGNKFWKDVDTNTNEGFKSYLQYYEDMLASHNLMDVSTDLTGLLQNEALDGMPNAKEYAQDYLRHATGRGVGDFGKALNTIIDMVPRTIGVGPSWTRATIHQVSKRLGQNMMGWFNMPFMGMQFLQIMQTALPEYVGFKKNLEMNGGDFTKHTQQGFADMVALTHEKLSGDKDMADPFRQEMFQFAHDNGLLNFSEFEDVHKVTQSKLANKYDTVADFTRTLGEVATRPLVFFTFARMLEKAGLPKGEIFGTALNKTQYAMVDYSHAEHPMMYEKLGQIGKTAGALKTFTHSFLGQQLDWMAKAKQGNAGPLLMGLAGTAMFAGIAGLPGYHEADKLFQWITNQAGERKTIRDTVLKETPSLLTNGVISDVLNVNLQGRLGMAQLLPESIWDAASPYGSKAATILGEAYQFAKDPNEITGRNLAKEAVPSSLRGPIEELMGKTDQGMTLDKEGRNDYPRTDRDWKLRRWGLTSMEEATDKERLYNQLLASMSDKEAQSSLLIQMKRGFRINSKAYGTSQDFATLRDKYKARGGDVSQLSNIITKDLEESKQSRKQRLQGIPTNTINSINRYKAYNE